jgi:hypothetical protein
MLTHCSNYDILKKCIFSAVSYAHFYRKYINNNLSMCKFLCQIESLFIFLIYAVRYLSYLFYIQLIICILIDHNDNSCPTSEMWLIYYVFIK